MSQYIQFNSENGAKILIETEEVAETNRGGIVKAGAVGDLISKTTDKVVVVVQTAFEQTLKEAIQLNAGAFVQAVRDMSPQDQPETMEVSFGLKVTGSVGNVAVAQGAVETNYTVTLTWKKIPEPDKK
jgi:phosphosulfolactate phosphohydrolase-like enzyme